MQKWMMEIFVLFTILDKYKVPMPFCSIQADIF